MRVEAIIRAPRMADVAGLSQFAEQAGFDGIGFPELGHDAFVISTVAAIATERIRLNTAVAIAFPRSPTITAQTARGIQDVSEGRFGLGLGTQVRGHIERRFGVPWSAPVERLREYIQAVRAVWHCWDTGEALEYRGEHYQLTLMPPDFSPGLAEHGPIPIQIGAVNERMLQLAGEECDAVRLHPFCTEKYMDAVVMPSLTAGAARRGRDLADLEIIGGGFIITGPDDAAVNRAREATRRQIAFYASTRSYAPVLALHGWEWIGAPLRRMIAEGRWDDLGSLISDEMLDAFCVSGRYEEIGARVSARFAGTVDWVTLAVAGTDSDLSAVVRDLQTIPGRA